MIEWIMTEGTGHYFFYSFPICLMILFIFLKDRRIRFLIPCFIITIIIVNPWFYEEWTKLGLYAYWRILWIIPVIPIIAAVIPMVVEKVGYLCDDATMNSQKFWIVATLKCIIASIGVVGVALGGSFIYNTTRGQFDIISASSAKIPDDVVKVADRLLELKEKPRVILQYPLGVYLRQYTGEIESLFGRDIDGYIFSPSALAQQVYTTLENPEADLKSVSRTMLDEGYDYLVMRLRDIGEDLHLVDTIGNYGIYTAVGNPSVQKKRNELDQVIVTTLLDEYGNPKNGNLGYANLYRDYDSFGNITYEYRTDKNNIAVLDGNGRAGITRTYQNNKHIIREVSLGANEQVVNNVWGYAEIIRIYDGDKLIVESYYDNNKFPTENINGYSYEKREYDRYGNMIIQSFYNSNGLPVIASCGYAEKRCHYNGSGNLIKEEYFGADGKPLIQTAGHVAIEQKWDGKHLSSRVYLDESDNPIERIDGYSSVTWEIDENGSDNICFYNLMGEEIGQSGLNYAKDILLGSDGWSEWYTPDNNVVNYGLYIGTMNLGSKKAGDKYTCQIEVEFKNVKTTQGEQFKFSTQGTADGSWRVGNPWNYFIYLKTAPEDGVYHFSGVGTIDENMEKVSVFNIGFRCDNWYGGAFRVRNIKIETGDCISTWTPGI